MKIFCIGFSRTGTSSLSNALSQLGFKTIHFPFPLYEDPNNKILLEYDAFADNPIPLYYEEFDKKFPGSKFILTTRKEKDWLDSMKWMFNKGVMMWKWNPEIHKMHEEIFKTSVFNKERLINSYRIHNNNVLSYFSGRQNDLLVLELEKDFNYKPLCKFLGKKIPTVPFPHNNERKKLYQIYILELKNKIRTFFR